MAYTLTASQIDDAVASALSWRMPTLVDNIYVGTPVLKALDSQERVIAQGGTQLEMPFLFAKSPGGSYQGMDNLDVTRRKTKSLLQLKWKLYYASVTIDGMTELQTSGYPALLNLVDTEMQAAELRLNDDMGADLYLDGTGNNSKALDGFDIAIAATGTYGGISRTADPEGTALVGRVDTTGGDLTLPLLQTNYGAATIGATHPDLISVPQGQWDAIWSRLQPQQRFPAGPMAEQIAAAGFSVMNFNGTPIVKDDKAPAGTVWGINTKYTYYVANERRANIQTIGPLTPVGQDAKVWRLHWAGNLMVGGPRFMFKMTGLN